MVERRGRPSANRIPISRVRWVTAKEITPYRPTNESRSASVPKACWKVPPAYARCSRIGRLLVQRAEIAGLAMLDRCCEGSLESIERPTRRSPKPYVEIRARQLWYQWESRPAPTVFRNITIADVSTTPTISLSGLASGAAPIATRAPRGLRPPKYRFTKASLTITARCPLSLTGSG